MFKVYLGLAALCLLGSSLAEQLVPLIAWSNSASLSGVQSSADMTSILKNVKIDQIDVAVILKSSSLSFDDIAKYGGVYGEKNAPLSNLQDFLSSSVSSLFASVSGEPASELTSSLSFAMHTHPLFVAGIAGIPSEFKAQQLYVVELPQGDDEETFKAHDTIISMTVSTLDKQDIRYAIFYSADHASSPTYEALNPDLVRRDLSEESYNKDDPLKPSNHENVVCFPILDANSDCSTGNDTCVTCLLFCMTPHIEYKQMDRGNVTQMGVAMNTNSSTVFTKINGSCNATDSELDGFPDFYDNEVDFAYIAFNATFTVNNSTDTFEKILAYTFVKGACETNEMGSNITDCGFWTMQLFAGDNISGLMPYTQYHTEKVYSRLAIPLTPQHNSVTSYACGNSTLNRFVRTVMNTTENFQHVGIQVQPFASLKIKGSPKKLHFGSAYNCQGYFGTTSLMGVVSVLILLLILYISTIFIFNIQTIDRFDDPRAETVKFENLH